MRLAISKGISKWAALAAVMLAPAAAQAANYELGAPFHMACEGTLVVHNGIYVLDVDDERPGSNPDDNLVCSSATLAEKSSDIALKYTLKEKEIARILQACSVGKLCRVEGSVRGLSHDVYFFVRIDSVSAR